MAVHQNFAVGVVPFTAVPGGISGRPTVTPANGVGTNWGYKIAAEDAAGNLSNIGAEGTTAEGAAVLDGTHTNVVTWTDPAGAVKIHIYRTTAAGTPNTTGHIATVNAGVQTFTDTGVAVLDGEMATATNYTGVGAAFVVDHYEKFSVYVTGGTVETWKVQVSPDGTNFLDSGSPVTNDGVADITSQAKKARVVVTAYTSGTPVGACVGLYSHDGG